MTFSNTVASNHLHFTFYYTYIQVFVFGHYTNVTDVTCTFSKPCFILMLFTQSHYKEGLSYIAIHSLNRLMLSARQRWSLFKCQIFPYV